MEISNDVAHLDLLISQSHMLKQKLFASGIYELVESTRATCNYH